LVGGPLVEKERTRSSEQLGVEGAGLILWVGGPPGASFGCYVRDSFQSQTHTEKLLYNERC